MAESEVTLLLGEQMAIIYLGVNILIPLVLSAVLAFITLVIVQLSRFVKKRMGSSYSKVVTLTPILSEKSDVSKSKKDNGHGLASRQKETRPVSGNGLVRKRRPSIISETAPSPEPIPSVSSEGSFTSSDHILPPSSRSGSAVSRVRRIVSSSRISPETPAEDIPKTPTLTGAWTENIFNETRDQHTGRKRKNSDRVASPSQCHMDGLADDVNVGKDKRNSVFADDMNVFEIW